MTALALCFLAGFCVGAITYWAARKIYWRYKWPLLSSRHYNTLRFRRYRLYPRRNLILRRLPVRSYAGRHSDYRLNKLFDRVDKSIGD